MAHITGGGLAGNVARVLPDGTELRIDRSTWTPAPVYDLETGEGRVPLAETERTLNMGVGMVAVVASGAVDQSLDALARRGVAAWAIGTVASGNGGVELVGAYAR
jgi:phosphoribosylformylglycinamidine cyclo-ligase